MRLGKAIVLLSSFILALGTKRKAEELYVEPLKHDISIISPRNFETHIQKYRDRFPAAILYYQRTNAAKRFINSVWDVVAKQLKGMAKVGAVNCDEFGQFCKNEDIVMTQDYEVKIYPPLPLASRKYESPLDDPQKFVSLLSKMIPPAKIQLLQTESEVLSFVANFPSIPKILLFTDRKKASPLYNAIAHSFADRMNFAMVSGSNLTDVIHKKFHVKKLPTLIIKKGDMSLSLKGAQTYRGDYNFNELHDWLNVHSETFVKGGGFITEKEPEMENITETRPWLAQKVPELTKASHHEVCFRKSKGLCAIYLVGGEGAPSGVEMEMLERLSDRYSQEKPGFHWCWLNVDNEPNYAKLFKLAAGEERKLPSLAVFNPHSRLRFSKLASEQIATEKNIESFIEKIMAGDGRFTMVKGNKVPAFAQKKKAKNEL